MFNKLFGKKVAAAKVELKKVENRDLMEAIVGGCLLVSAADGEIEKKKPASWISLSALTRALRISAMKSHPPSTAIRNSLKLASALAA